MYLMAGINKNHIESESYTLEISDLEVFRIVADEKSISQAAKRLNYVQSNVTVRIKRLETELRTQLFYRHARGVTLTSTGKTLLIYTDKLFSVLEEAKNAIYSDEIPRGSLTIGSIESVAAIRLPDLLTSFMTHIPQVDLSLKGGTTEALVNEVLEYKLDGAFVTGPVDHPDLVQHTFREEELMLITDKVHSKIESFKDISQRTILTLEQGCKYKKRFETWMETEGLYPKRRMRFSSLEGIVGCVKSGLGISLLSKSYVSRLPIKEELNLYPIPNEYSGIVTIFIHRKDVLLTRALQEFKNWFELG